MPSRCSAGRCATSPGRRGWLIQTVDEGSAVGKGITDPVYGTWGESTEAHKPLANIFTGALFCDLADLPRAFEPACKAFTDAGGSTAVTLRFMKGGHGLLSPARWDDTAGIDFDGPHGETSEDAYKSVAAALDAIPVKFTRHWGKYNGLDAARVAGDYGGDLGTWKSGARPPAARARRPAIVPRRRSSTRSGSPCSAVFGLSAHPEEPLSEVEAASRRTSSTAPQDER